MTRADPYALSRCPDYKEGIASENAETILLTLEKFLLKPEQFHIWALHNTAIPTGINTELKGAIQEAIKTDTLTGQKLKEILTSGPRQVNKGLQEWNYKDGLILYKGLMLRSKGLKDATCVGWFGDDWDCSVGSPPEVMDHVSSLVLIGYAVYE